MRITLEGSPWVWVGDGFRDLTQVALDSPSDFRQAAPHCRSRGWSLFMATGSCCYVCLRRRMTAIPCSPFLAC